MTTFDGSYSEETLRKTELVETKKMLKAITRNQQRGEKIIEAMRAGLHRYVNSTRGERSLGVKCKVTVEHSQITMLCKDGTVFKIGFK
jgi:hypothetical protein